MSLYGKTDTTTNQNKAKNAVGIKASATVGGGPNSVTKTFVYVDDTEAALHENKTRGIDGPGWWAYSTYTTASGATKHRAEKLVCFSGGETNANESLSDDTVAADVASAVTITGQPANATTVSGAATFTVTTSTTGTPGTLTYQWQRQTATGTTWANVTNTGIYTGTTTATLTLTGATISVDGYKYRVKINSAGGTEEVISNGAATLTFGT
jgi:hypothetical protein